MTSLSAVFQLLNEMKAERVIQDYAIGGAMAVLFYAEPARTYDLDVFVLLSEAQGPIVQLTPIYSWLQERGFRPEGEHVMVHGVPVQFLPAYNDLVEEAVKEARELDYDGVGVRVTSPEHLIALALQAGGFKRRERAAQLLECGAADRPGLQELLARFEISFEALRHET